MRIGLEAPLSGDLQAAGAGMLNGATLAAEEINARGGLKGKEIEIVPIDDGGDPAIGVPAARKAIGEGLDGVVAAWNTGVGIETLPLYENAGLVPIRLAAGNELAGLGFTVSPMSSQVAPVTADALSKWIGAKTVAIGFDPTQSYSNQMSRAVRSRLESAGVEITAFEPVEPGAEDYSDTVKKLAAGNPDAVFYSVYFPEGALIAKATPSGGRARPAYSATPPTTPATWRMRERPRPVTARWSACRHPTSSRAPRPTSPITRIGSAKSRRP